MFLIADSISMSVGDRVLFSNLSFSVGAGEIVALMGPSGVGKSTLLAGIAGIVPLLAGMIRLDRHPRSDGHASTAVEAPRVHWMFQSSPLLTRRTALDNVALAHELRGESREVAVGESRTALDSLGLATVASEPMHRLSGGERQRVAVARALAAQPHLLLADEPTASLDADTRAIVTDTLVSVARGGAVVLVATHDRWVADRCDDVIELRGAEC